MKKIFIVFLMALFATGSGVAYANKGIFKFEWTNSNFGKLAKYESIDRNYDSEFGIVCYQVTGYQSVGISCVKIK